MEREFRLPDLGSGLREATIVAWQVSVGDDVETDDSLCEVETEKAVIEIPVPYTGSVAELRGAEGDIVKVGDVLAVLLVDGEAPEEATPPEPGTEERGGATVEPADGPLVSPSTAARPSVMPVIRKMARAHGIDLAEVEGTGRGGRITRTDIEALVAAGETRDVDRSPGTSESLSLLRRAISAHLTEQWQTVPHVAVHTTVDASRFVQVLAALKARLGRLPVEALIVKALVPAAAAYPRCNAAIDGNRIVYHTGVDIGVAVDTADGLVVPVVRQVDRMSLSALAVTIDDLMTRARRGALTQEESGGQTVTVSNLGALGGGHANQIVPRGTTAIVSIGRIEDTAVVRGGEMVIAPVMPLSASFDHRAVDGGEAQRFINELKAGIEEPTLVLVNDRAADPTPGPDKEEKE